MRHFSPYTEEELAQWQFFYNWQRPHGSLKGKPPSAIVAELSEITPLSEEVSNNYKVDNERIQIANLSHRFNYEKIERISMNHTYHSAK